MSLLLSCIQVFSKTKFLSISMTMSYLSSGRNMKRYDILSLNHASFKDIHFLHIISPLTQVREVFRGHLSVGLPNRIWTFTTLRAVFHRPILTLNLSMTDSRSGVASAACGRSWNGLPISISDSRPLASDIMSTRPFRLAWLG
jgi:hypothetical protein